MLNFGFNFGRSRSSRPPCYSTVLSWHRGISKSNLLLDSAPALGTFDIQMTDGPALSPNGVDDSFTTAVNHGSIVSYQGTATLSYDGATLTSDAGTFYDLRFSDDTHYPCIGKTDLVNPTTTSATNGSVMTIVSSDYVAIWAGFQQTLFTEVTDGFWEDAQGRYPFAKVGATYHPGGWNYPQNKFKYKEDGVGNFDGVGDRVELSSPMIPSTDDFDISIIFRADDGSGNRRIISQYNAINDGRLHLSTSVSGQKIPRLFINGPTSLFLDSSVALVDGNLYKIRIKRSGDTFSMYLNGNLVGTEDVVGIVVDVSTNTMIGSLDGSVDFFSGNVWVVDINGLLIPLNDGELFGDTTTDTHDSNGNIVGALTSSDVPAFWSQVEVPYAIQQVDAPYNMFTNTDGEALEWRQSVLEELGGEWIINGLFTEWTDPTVPDVWLKTGTHDATNYVEEASGVGMRLVSDGALVGIGQDDVFTELVEYSITIIVESITGSILIDNFEGITSPVISTVGTHTFTGTNTNIASRLNFKRSTPGLATDAVVRSISVREVNPIVNVNDQYFFGSIAPRPKELIVHENKLVEPCLSQTLTHVGV